MGTKNEAIQVVYALADRTGFYSKLAGTSICSLFENTKSRIVVHIFNDGTINDDNKEKFNKLGEMYKQTIKLYNVKDEIPDILEEAKKIFADAMQSAQYTEAALYRLVAHNVLPENIKKIIYIDCDTIVNIDVKKLWDFPMDNGPLAAVRESTLLMHYGKRGIGDAAEPMYEHMKDAGVNLETCFNSGVLIMNLDDMRRRGDILLSGLRILSAYPEKNYFYDQNILNYYFAKTLVPLPWNYNILMHWDRKHGKAEIVEGIYHYMGKALGMNGADVRDTIYYDYFMKTPWCDGEYFCRLTNVMSSVFIQMFGPRLRAMRRFSAAIANKRLVVSATDSCKIDAFKLFSSPDEYDKLPDILEEVPICIRNKNGDESCSDIKYTLPDDTYYCSLGKDDDLKLDLPYDVDKHFYLIFAKDYKKVKTMLEGVGLKEKSNFMNGSFLLVGKPWLDRIIDVNKFFEML